MHTKLMKGLLATAGMFLLMGCPPEPEDTADDTYQMMRVKSPDAGWRIEVVDPTKDQVKDLNAN